ncbi:hypothetical protein PFISCL1PPCAC_26499 [Pristionchus fissidentatus]|uniref:Uncharacterized protein n=1 Tax=Pristionchus fissidentatus TaxID=1538716 RepID=A0AAV5WZM6_9BILA|nr:hypothetical protein PFISCL1PPCAC_26499 [Pristionchus fissidentatus]
MIGVRNSGKGVGILYKSNFVIRCLRDFDLFSVEIITGRTETCPVALRETKNLIHDVNVPLDHETLGVQHKTRMLPVHRIVFAFNEISTSDLHSRALARECVRLLPHIDLTAPTTNSLLHNGFHNYSVASPAIVENLASDNVNLQGLIPLAELLLVEALGRRAALGAVSSSGCHRFVQCCRGDAYARSRCGSGLDESLGALVADESSHSRFAQTLTRSLIARGTDRSHRMTIAFFAYFPVSGGFSRVSEEAGLAQMAVSACSIVSAVDAHSSRSISTHSEDLRIESTSFRMKITVAGNTGISSDGRCSCPWAIVVEGLASLTVRSRRVVLAVTSHLSILVIDTTGGVSVALAPTAHRQLAHRVEVTLLVVSAVLSEIRGERIVYVIRETVELRLIRTKSGEDDTNVRRGHPVLQDGRLFEGDGRWSIL